MRPSRRTRSTVARAAASLCTTARAGEHSALRSQLRELRYCLCRELRSRRCAVESNSKEPCSRTNCPGSAEACFDFACACRLRALYSVSSMRHVVCAMRYADARRNGTRSFFKNTVTGTKMAGIGVSRTASTHVITRPAFQHACTRGEINCSYRKTGTRGAERDLIRGAGP